MIDPIIFSVQVLGVTLTLRWYGVLVMFGTLAGSWLAEKEVRRRGENGEVIWDLLLWVLPAGIVGARLWYVATASLGGNRDYLENPVQIFNIPQGGLHFFGGLLFGGLALLAFLKTRGLDPWLFLDAIAPAALLGQALARPANFINQELYGPPTRLPWGIPIEFEHRLEQYRDLSLYPEASTRFHPTFAYEMIWNILVALLLLWFSRQFQKRIKPGAVFGGWLVLAGVGRVLIEFFRPDQPKIPGIDFTYSALVAGLMAVAGALILLVRYEKVRLAAAEHWATRYRISGTDGRPRGATVTGAPADGRKRGSSARRRPRPGNQAKHSR